MENKISAVSFYKPRIEDLWFRQAMLADPDTMSYNAAWGGTIPFPREDWQDWYDAWTGDPGVRFYPYHHWNDHGSGHRIGYNGQLPGNSGVATAGTKYRIKSHLDAGAQWYTVETFQNGNWSAPVRVERAYANPVDTGLPLYLFAINFDGVPRYPGQSRVYKLKFWEKQPNGSYKLTREFVPCMKDGKAMLWDRVSETFFRNRGRYLISGGGNERKWRENSMAIVIR